MEDIAEIRASGSHSGGLGSHGKQAGGLIVALDSGLEVSLTVGSERSAECLHGIRLGGIGHIGSSELTEAAPAPPPEKAGADSAKGRHDDQQQKDGL